MRYIVMHKIDPKEDPHAPPPQELIASMGALIDGSVKSGVFVDGDGLRPIETRARVRSAAGVVTVERGPYAGSNELCQRLAQIRVASMDAAIDCARRYLEVLGDSEIEIGPIVEAWDLGFMPRPTGLDSERFLLVLKSDARSEAGEPLLAERKVALALLESELTASRILRSTVAIAPSRRGKRSGAAKQRSWTDGPFAESKELISGFSILELPSLEDALEWAGRYGAILDGSEVDVRPLED
ncbi:MAG TPA: YciI family protein [Polyangiaceae bacterium]|nr:YciI family protein [Polyangiaceae bacterium]